MELEFHWGSFFINNFELSTCILTFSELEYYGTRVSYTRFPLTFFFPQKARLAPLYSKSKWNSSFIYSSFDGFFFSCITRHSSLIFTIKHYQISKKAFPYIFIIKHIFISKKAFSISPLLVHIMENTSKYTCLTLYTCSRQNTRLMPIFLHIKMVVHIISL